MQRRVLEALASRGSMVGLVASLPDFDFSYSDFIPFAHSISKDAPFLFIDFTQKPIDDIKSSISAELLFSRKLDERDLEELSSCEKKSSGNTVLKSFAALVPKTGSSEVFLSNLKLLHTKYPYIFILFGNKVDGEFAQILAAMRMVIILGNSGILSEDFLSELESQFPYPPFFFWWCAKLPDKKRFPHLFCAAKNASVEGFVSSEAFFRDSENSRKVFFDLLKIKILSENPLEGLPRLFRFAFIPLCVIVLVAPFVLPTVLSPSLSLLRNMKSEASLYSDAPYFDFAFNGAETLERIGRYAIGKFAATVTTEAMLSSYIEETLQKNNFPEGTWFKDNIHIPPAGINLRFSPPEHISNPSYDSIAPAWKYFTGIISDSIAYLTELYHPIATATQRQHTAIDVASHSGARILAPFSGKAWTFTDERGGVVIGLVHNKRVILFMHCDQLLYLDGQEVMEGDPVATVGTTGHTTGPHVHIVTGIVNKNGTKMLGNVKYNIVNPVTWFYSGK
ncbi:MAG: M23 family metallopeptidase [Fibrobacteraceae bacterium]|nr:M23 family metallopeptidase [Fibrobacteraceae bacterium]